MYDKSGDARKGIELIRRGLSILENIPPFDQNAGVAMVAADGIQFTTQLTLAGIILNIAAALYRLSLCFFKQAQYFDKLLLLRQSGGILTRLLPLSKLMIDGE